MHKDFTPDIYQDIPSREFPDLVLGLCIGENFEAHVQVQHGFIRGALFTSCSARWLSNILVNDEDNRIALMELIFDFILSNSRKPYEKPNLKVLKET
jgi:hypothetical protein